MVNITWHYVSVVTAISDSKANISITSPKVIMFWEKDRRPCSQNSEHVFISWNIQPLHIFANNCTLICMWTKWRHSTHLHIHVGYLGANRLSMIRCRPTIRNYTCWCVFCVPSGWFLLRTRSSIPVSDKCCESTHTHAHTQSWCAKVRGLKGWCVPPFPSHFPSLAANGNLRCLWQPKDWRRSSLFTQYMMCFN